MTIDETKPIAARMDLWLGFIGFADVSTILVEPTLSDPSNVERMLNQALDQAATVAGKF